MAPGPRASMAAALHQDQLLVFGGVSDNETKGGEDLSSEFFNDLYIFNAAKRRWFAAQYRTQGTSKTRKKGKLRMSFFCATLTYSEEFITWLSASKSILSYRGILNLTQLILPTIVCMIHSIFTLKNRNLCIVAIVLLISARRVFGSCHSIQPPICIT